MAVGFGLGFLIRSDSCGGILIQDDGHVAVLSQERGGVRDTDVIVQHLGNRVGFSTARCQQDDLASLQDRVDPHGDRMSRDVVDRFKKTRVLFDGFRGQIDLAGPAFSR